MGTDKVAVIGFQVANHIILQGVKEVETYLTNKTNIYGRMLFILEDYLTIHSKKFEKVSFFITSQINQVLPNGTLLGIVGEVNRSKIDIGVHPVAMNERSTDTVDFSFPYRMNSATFVTRKPEYKPDIFRIFQTFSLPLWIAIISFLIAMSLVCFVTMKRRYSYDKTLLHTFAVLLRQGIILKSSSMIENLLVFSWVVGAMFLCLAFDSVFLSFLAFPPITPIKDVPQLAKAVKEGHFHCIAPPLSYILRNLLNSNDENLRIIGLDVQTNNLSNGNAFEDFLNDRIKDDLAFLVDTNIVDILTVGKKFVSDDRFLEGMSAMIVRKDFCCKKLLEKFVHRIMSSGLYFKYQIDKSFLIRMPRLLKYQEKDTSKRMLTLTDVAPAFMFLVFGHVMSFVVLMAEILLNRWKRNKKRMRIAKG